MTKKEKAAFVIDKLEELFPEVPIPLEHHNPFSLLVAVVLSAQSTDAGVNKVTPELFRLAPDPFSMSGLSVEEILQVIRTVGLAPTKAKNIRKLAQQLIDLHGGEVPQTFEELEALPGVGHKTASVVMSQAFGFPAFPVDTHIHRLMYRWGLTSGKNVVQTEVDAMKLFPESLWNKLHLQIIYFGRQFCPARNHEFSTCPICGAIGRKKNQR